MSMATLNPPVSGDPQQMIASISNKSLTVTQRLKSVGDFMNLQKNTMFTALPKHITPDRLIRVALNSIRKTPKLLDCSPASLFAAIIEASALGLEPNGVLGHAYLVPYGTECTLIPGYKGLMDLCRRSSTVSTFTAEVVRDGDKFVYQLGDDPFVKHVPNDSDPKRHEKKVTHVYVVVTLRDGGVQRKVWSASQIDAHKEKYSQGWRYAEKNKKKDSPWHTNWDVMAKKTVIRDMIGRGEIPVSVEIQNLAMREEVYESERARVIDAAMNGVSLGDLDNALTGSTATEPEDDNDPPPDAVGYTEPAVWNEVVIRAQYAECKTDADVTALTNELLAIHQNQAASLGGMEAMRKGELAEAKAKKGKGGQLPLNP